MTATCRFTRKFDCEGAPGPGGTAKKGLNHAAPAFVPGRSPDPPPLVGGMAVPVSRDVRRGGAGAGISCVEPAAVAAKRGPPAVPRGRGATCSGGILHRLSKQVDSAGKASEGAAAASGKGSSDGASSLPARPQVQQARTAAKSVKRPRSPGTDQSTEFMMREIQQLINSGKASSERSRAAPPVDAAAAPKVLPAKRAAAAPPISPSAAKRPLLAKGPDDQQARGGGAATKRCEMTAAERVEAEQLQARQARFTAQRAATKAAAAESTALRVGVMSAGSDSLLDEAALQPVKHVRRVRVRFPNA